MKTIDLIKPDIYDAFQCKGAACRRTCCTGWRITVSKSEYQDLKAKLKHIDARSLQRLPETERTSKMYGEFVLEDETGCSLQSEEGLCQLQLSYGAEALPDVCAFFPRKGLRAGDEMELSLTPACERVLELLMEKEGSLEFVRQNEPLPPLPAAQISGRTAKADWKRHIQLEEFCILLLQAEDISLDQRMALLGLGIHEIDAYYKNGEGHKISSYIDQYLAALSETEDVSTLLPLKAFHPSFLLGNFFSFTAFSSRFAEVLDKVNKELQITVRAGSEPGTLAFSYPTEEYVRRRKQFDEFETRHPFFLENTMVMLFVLEHWASRPSDLHSIWEQYMYACWVYSNLKLALTACIETAASDEDLLDICVILLRGWIHSAEPKKQAIKHFHDTGCDTPAHMAMLVQAGGLHRWKNHLKKR